MNTLWSLEVNKMKAVKWTTKKDFNKAVEEFCKFCKEVFAGSDEDRKLQLLDGMKNLMNSKSSVKRPIEVLDGKTSINEYNDIIKEITNLSIPSLKTISFSTGIKNSKYYRRFEILKTVKLWTKSLLKNWWWTYQAWQVFMLILV